MLGIDDWQLESLEIRDVTGRYGHALAPGDGSNLRIGSYSTIYVASPMVLHLHLRRESTAQAAETAEG